MNKTIAAAINASQTTMPDYFATLLGERKRGSKWGREFTLADFELPWREASDEVNEHAKDPTAQYFKLENAREYFPEMKLGAIPLTELSGLSHIQHVTVQEGEHGAELCIPDVELCGLSLDRDFNEAWLIIGDHEGERVVFTAHPGPVMAFLPKDEGEVSVEELYESDRPIAVKVL